MKKNKAEVPNLPVFPSFTHFIALGMRCSPHTSPDLCQSEKYTVAADHLVQITEQLSSPNFRHPGLRLHISIGNLSISAATKEKLAYHRITEYFSLEKTFKIIKSDHKSNTAKSTTKQRP